MQDPRIYSDAYQLSLTIFHRTKSFAKAYRPTLGGGIERAAMNLTVSIRRATTDSGGGQNYSPRLESIREASQLLDQIRIFLQLAHDLGTLPPSGFSELSELTGNLGKQIGGLLRYELKKMRKNDKRSTHTS